MQCDIIDQLSGPDTLKAVTFLEQGSIGRSRLAHRPAGNLKKIPGHGDSFLSPYWGCPRSGRCLHSLWSSSSLPDFSPGDKIDRSIAKRGTHTMESETLTIVLGKSLKKLPFF